MTTRRRLVTRRRLIGGATLLAIAACGGDPAEDPAAESSGVSRWSVHEIQRLGGPDVADRPLSLVEQVLLGPGGELIVTQPQDGDVRVYERSGELRSLVGRTGRGPGEFAALGPVGLWQDTLYAVDLGLGRVSFFLLDGTFQSSFPFQPEGVRGSSAAYLPARPQALVLTREGTALVVPSLIITGDPDSIVVPALRLVPSDREPHASTTWAVSTLAWQSSGAVPRSAPRDMVSRGVRFRFGIAFPTEPIMHLSPDGRGVVLVEREPAPDTTISAFRVTLIDPQGDTVYSRSIPYRPVSLTPEGIRTAMEVAPVQPVAADREVGSDIRPDPSDLERAQRAAGLIPPTLPPVTGLALGQDGTVWIRREASTAETVEWTVLDGYGRVAGVVELPATMEVATASDDHVVAVDRDRFDVETVLLFQIGRGH